MLYTLYLPGSHRNTKDADFQMYGHYDKNALTRIFREICSLDEEDGIRLNRTGIEVKEAGEDREYPGYVVTIPAALGIATCKIQVDIGFGEIITPGPKLVSYPSIIGLAEAQIKVYPLESVVSEKFQAIVHLGMRNSRMKDFYDLATLASQREFDGQVLSQAIINTFAHRKTIIPTETPIGLTETFFSDRRKQRDWENFHTRHGLGKSLSLADACSQIVRFVMPVAQAAAEGRSFKCIWKDDRWNEPQEEAVNE